MEKMISVIVCTYNQEKTIARTLDSILMQQCHVPIEIIIGEDCSTDGTRAVCKKYAELHPDTIRLIGNDHNKGVQDNYFDCMLTARGEYIGDCAGDDFWTDPLKLEKEVCILEQYPEVMLVHTDWNYYNESDGSTRPSGLQPFSTPIIQGRKILKAILTQTSRPVVHLCTSLYRKAPVLQALEEDESLFRNNMYGCEDMQVAFVLAEQGDIAYLPDVTLYYSHGHDSMSSPDNEKKQYRFKQRTTALCHYMAQRQHIDIDKFLQLRVFAMGMHAFRLHSTELRDETLNWEKKWNVVRDGRISFLFTIMRYEWLWQLCLVIRNFIVSVKKLFR